MSSWSLKASSYTSSVETSHLPTVWLDISNYYRTRLPSMSACVSFQPFEVYPTDEGKYLVFRREPLWKVSMNVRIHPSVRCIYEAEENILRLILHEYIELPNVPQED